MVSRDSLVRSVLYVLYMVPTLRSQEYRIIHHSHHQSSNQMDVVSRLKEMHTKDYGE